jgi:predicted translin family RNA/ssDNA-binding protein
MSAERVYRYDRTASSSPANRIQEGATYLRQAAREIERAENILRGLHREIAMVAGHTSDRAMRQNLEAVKNLDERTEVFVKDLKRLLEEYEHAARGYH